MRAIEFSMNEVDYNGHERPEQLLTTVLFKHCMESRICK